MAAAPTAAFAGTNCNANVSVPLNQSVVKNLNSCFTSAGVQNCFKNLNCTDSKCYVKFVDGKLQLVSDNNCSQSQTVQNQKSKDCNVLKPISNGTTTNTNTGKDTTTNTNTGKDTTTNTNTGKDTTTNTNTGKDTTTNTNTGKDTTTNTNTGKDTTTNPNTGKDTTTNNTGTFGSYEQQVVDIVNQERAKSGLAPLTINAKLSQVAEKKAEDMRDQNYFSHTSPTYGSPFDMMKQFGITYTAAGENIAKGQKTPQDVMTAWMNSSGHRANIMNSNYQQIGVGYVTDSNGTTYWVQEFIK
ncbi:serine protease [Aminipila luticellarii]|uniref:Serine protease n=2 Tax=Aminipila luticellarii TaxID=2507160 RepID=A0A410PYQ8_9FIRM|nr:serine protease [Aminipila luticellarii]